MDTPLLVPHGTLREKQITALKRLLNLNHNTSNAPGFPYDAPSGDEEEPPTWKILIFDRFAQDMISTLLKVNDLRENGITVHMPLTKERVPITDAPAIYFVQPTAENIHYIEQDIAKNLYDLYYINFTRPVPRDLLEDLAAAVARSNKAPQIAQVYDQYLSFSCPENELFTLSMANSFQRLHDPKSTGTLIERLVGEIADSMYTVLTTMNEVPVIRCPRGGPAEMVANKLDTRLRENILNPRYSLFTDSTPGTAMAPSGRCLLVLLDRDFNFASMLSHSWTYQALIHDVLDFQRNRVQYSTQERGRAVKKVYDISVQDFFWAQNAANPFPQVAVEVDEESKRFKKQAEEITRMGGVSDLEEINQLDMTTNTKLLKSAISALPELTARKAVIDMHMNIATAVLNIIKKRQLDVFFQLEEAIHKQSKSTLLETILDPSKTTPEDKLRLFLIYYLTVADLSDQDYHQFEEALGAAGCNLASLRFIKKSRSLSQLSTVSAQPTGGPAVKSGSDLLGRFSSIGSKLTDHLREGGGNLSSIIAGVRNLLPSRCDLPVTKIVEALLQGSTAGERSSSFANRPPVPGASPAGAVSGSAFGTEDYLYLDPKQTKRGALASSGARLARPKVSYSDVVVFVVGGGNYLEYQNLQQFAQTSVPPKSITYGATEICNPTQFLQQLAALAPLATSD
ncbi:Vesicle trafficking between the ER and Golgi [Dispira simplex]|nr:Vesicle trafficking between the ER and Golgi [Dispira simplex]